MNEKNLTLFLSGQQIRNSKFWVSVPGLTYLERKDNEVIPFKLTSLDILAGRDMSENTAPDIRDQEVSAHIHSIVLACQFNLVHQEASQ
jgi:hypothetical protein